MRIIELAAALAVVIAVGLAALAAVAMARVATATAGRVRGAVRRAGAVARQPDRLALDAAGRLARLTDPAELGELRVRVTLRRSVAGAQAAVRAAERAGAPVGDLPGLARRLATEAELIEARLAVSPGDGWGRAPSAARRSAREDAEALIAMAGEAHRAAADAMAAMSAPTTQALADEVAEVVAGVRAAAAWLRERGSGRTRPGAA